MSELQRKFPPGTDELLRTKLAPPRLHAERLPRPSLLARLDEGLARKLTLISAPAGFGKTTLLLEWVYSHERGIDDRGSRSEASDGERGVGGSGSPIPLSPTPLKFAWVSLDAGDNDPARFWRYGITACSAFGAGLGRPALAALRTSQQPPYETVLTSFINELVQLPTRCVLVLDDYHVITSPQVHGTVEFLLAHLPESLHLVLVARREPPLPIARLRARGELSELGPADLRFSLEEMQSFLQQNLRLSLSAEAVSRLEEQTEGWAAGLRLAALALQGHQDSREVERLAATFSGGHRYVLEYLTAEVLAAQPESIQVFLLQTSFLERLTGSLCDAVTGRADSELLLEQLERANQFLVPLTPGGQRAWYRYHSLFAEALRHEARRRQGQASVQALQARASEWYEAHGLIGEAVEAALAAGEAERAAELMERFFELHGINEIHTLRRWAEALPTYVLYTRPFLLFLYTQAFLYTSDRFAAGTAAALEAPLRLVEEAWQGQKDRSRLGQALSFRAVVAFWQGDLVRSFQCAHQSLEVLDEYDIYWRGVSLGLLSFEALSAGKIHSAQRLVMESRVLCEAAQNIHGTLAAMLLLGEVYAGQGEFEGAVEHYQQALAGAVGGDEMLDDQGYAHLGLSAVSLERNELDQAEQHASTALQLARQRSNEALQVQASLIQARVWWAQGQIERAQQYLQTLASRTSRTLLLREVQVWQARLALAIGDAASAARWVESVSGMSDPVPGMQQEREALVTARLWIVQDKTSAALELLEGWRADAHQQGRVRSEIEILCLEALAHLNGSDRSKAQEALARALALGQPKGFLRVFLDEGGRMRLLIEDCRLQIDREKKRGLLGYIDQLLLAFRMPGEIENPKSSIKNLIEPLTPQEQRVLRLLVAGLSYPEIARELVVSTNTIKTQVKSIYRKLNVNSREQARQVVLDLKLL